MRQLIQARISISGLVQGLGFRPFVYREAVKHDLKGYVQNLGDAGIEIVVEGTLDNVNKFISALKENKPAAAIYDSFKVEIKKYKGRYSSFEIIASSKSKKNIIPSFIPPDISICEKCLQDINNPKDRHFKYPFTACAECGPRYTILYDIPYDRETTSMKHFPLCKYCGKEFLSPEDRRFNAQTICCPLCGPKLFLLNNRGEHISCKDVISEVSKLLSEGYILAIKGIGGFHIAVDAEDDHALKELRKRRRKPNKPLAVMSLSLEKVEEYAIVEEKARELLTSYAKPIVVLPKRKPFPLSEYVSPGLDSVGVMLPYSGIHYLILKEFNGLALVMTSANYPGEPMVTSNEDAISKLSKVVDYIVIHDREIVNRCDDSVVKVFGNGRHVMVRRSRGYAPLPVKVPFTANVVAVGPELCVTGAVQRGDQCFLTQHIGDVETLETLEFLEGTVRNLMRLLRVNQIEAVCHDLHPRYLTNIVAEKLSGEFNCENIAVQHHHAHMASLMAENRLSPDDLIICIVCDGVGYGLDGNIWGGEILLGDFSSFERKAHLEYKPMPGGDLCSIWYGRMLQAMLADLIDREHLAKVLIERYSNGFIDAEREIELIYKQIDRGVNLFYTSSTGRLLDAIACMLGICHKRTYEGEGAMKLESVAKKCSRDFPRIKPSLSYEKDQIIIETSPLLVKLFEILERYSAPALAYAAHYYLANSLAEAAIEIAKDEGIKIIGFSGGVAYNEIITGIIEKKVTKEGFKLLLHRNIPCGDGGISLGQACVGAANLR